jgi:hypothetical protein
MRRAVWLLSLVACLAVSTTSFAQDEDEEAESPAADEAGDVEGAAVDAEAAAEDAKPEAAKAAAPSGATWWVGPYVNGVLVPSFMLKLFLAASPSVFNAAFGATIAHRNPDGFTWVLGIGYAGYGFDGPFRAKGDPELDTEYLESSVGLLHVRGQLLWASEISRTLTFEYGVGIDLGVVLGEMKRTEAYKDASGQYRPCVGVATPDLNYCEPTTNGLATNKYNEEGAHYHVVEKRVPPVAAALMVPALALRFQPIDKLAIKLEAAFGLLQFTFGLSAAYAIGS